MHSIAAFGPSLLSLLGLLLFVAPFIDLPISRRLEAAPSAERRLRLYRFVFIYLWLLAAFSWIYRGGTEIRMTHAPGEAPWLFGAHWRTWGIAALVTLFFAVALKPGIDCILRPGRAAAYTRAMKSIGWFLPHDAQQRHWFVWLSITAGVCEEWIFRDRKSVV